ncbi:MAG: RNA-splicing ligase RtcB [Acidobacteria bacterium]|nr:RNA-splicing ligase RtcB [Acidobacteriota bacterium]
MRFAHRLQPIDAYRWRIPRDADYGMRTDVRIYASRALVDQIRSDDSLDQAANVATLPGIVGSSLAMPDIHQGYGFPIGGVCATDPARGGVVSPGGVGFDINCGVRLLRTNLDEPEVRASLDELVEQTFRDVPCGTGGSGFVKINEKDLDGVLAGGARWMTAHGYGPVADAERCEAGGSLPEADPGKVSLKAKQRGRPQLGTLGSGNHFLEVQYVESIHDAEAARAFGLEAGQVVVLIHSGSRGLGHQVCTDALKQMGAAMKRYGIELPDRQLACVPADSPEGRDYLAAMRAAANFAWANRQAITHFLRNSFATVFGARARLGVVYDVCHNIAKLERHDVDGDAKPVLVHRKGATRAFPPRHPETPAAYRAVGQPVFIPGSMGTASWVLAGQEGSMRESFGTCCHGAGRLLSRKAAKQGRTVEDVLAALGSRGIVVRSETRKGLLEEIPEAYKDVDEVIEVVHSAGLAKKVARLRPMGVIKG